LEWIYDRGRGKGTDLAVKKIAPRVRRGFVAERFKIPKTGHRLEEIGASQRATGWIKTDRELVLVVVPDVLEN
jgi:hypothetical protein